MFPAILRRDILLLLGAKVLALTAIYFFFFAPFEKPPGDPGALRAHLLDTQR